MENAMQGMEERQKGEVAKLHQRVTALHQGTIDVKDLAHNCADLLDLRLQCIEESARSRRFLQCSVATVQSEVVVMKSTQTELLTTMQLMDKLLEKLVVNSEQGAPVGDGDGTLSPIAKEI